MTKLHYATTHDTNLKYLLRPKMIISDPFFYVEVDGVKHVYLHSTDRDAYLDEAPEGVEVHDASEYRATSIGGVAIAALKSLESERELVVPNNFPLDIAECLVEGGYEVTVENPWCPERTIKSDTDIVAIEENMQTTTRAFALIESLLKQSVIKEDVLELDGQALTSERLKAEVEHLLLTENMYSTDGLVVSCAQHAAMPHHEGEGVIRPHQTIVVDIFPQHRSNHYYADMTRTYVKGEPSEMVKKLHAAVLDSHEQSLAAVKAGAATAELYEISKKVILEHGFDVGEEGYTHSLGHGLGMEVHEAPSLSPQSREMLESGHVITIEPGLYYPQYGGVRIEDTIVVTVDGYRNLTNYPKDQWIIS